MHDARSPISKAAPAALLKGAASPRPVLGLREAIMLIVGVVIGAGIFNAPAMVAKMTGDVGWMFGAWLLGGLVSLIGALCYAELTTACPHAGGDYHFLQRAYGRSVAFLFGWARFAVITTGSMALLAFVFGDYMNQVLPLGAWGSPLYAAALIIMLSGINLHSLRSGATTQSWLTMLEVFGLLLLAVAAASLVSDALPATAALPAQPLAPTAFGLAMVFVLLTYGGWNEAAYISAEVRDGHRNMVRALTWSIGIITVLYLLVIWAFWKGLGLQRMAASNAIAADLMGVAFGPAGQIVIAVLVVVSAVTSLNATMIVGARSNWALGRDWPVLGRLGGWDAQRNTPSIAVGAQSLAALLLVAVGAMTGSGFKSMVEFTAPVFWLFFLLSGFSLFVLRVREPNLVRPFKVPLYPLLPLLFCGMCGYMLWSSLSYVYNQSLGGLNAAWIGLAVLALGLLFLLLMQLLSMKQKRVVVYSPSSHGEPP